MKRITLPLILGLTLTLALLALLPSEGFAGSTSSVSAMDEVIFVNQNVTSTVYDGESWETAYKFLEDALQRAEFRDRIWVAAGVYTPTNEASPNATFQLIHSVTLYGGFAGGEENLEDRDWETNLTILSGDLDGNDETPNGIVTDVNVISGTNAYHVVTGSGVNNRAILDGFIITAGYANGDTEDDQKGGGMLNQEGSPTLRNITFSGNRAALHGGGMENNTSSTPELEEVTFINNQADDDGGGMHNDNSNPELTNVSFSGNLAVDGGGMFNYESEPSLEDVTFDDNHATSSGGGMNNTDSSNASLIGVVFHNNHTDFRGGGMFNGDSSPSLTNVIFSNNHVSDHGAGMYNWESNPSLEDVTFSSNEAGMNGGGMYSVFPGGLKLVSVTFRGNQAGVQGGGMYNGGGITTSLTNVIFSGNQANLHGGGMYDDGSISTLINVTFSGNYANGFGGGIYQKSGGYIMIANTIMWDDDDSTSPGNWGEVYFEGEYAFVSSLVPGYTYLLFDPWFIDPVSSDQAPTTAGNYHLHDNSLAIDCGENMSVTVSTDLDGKARIADGNRDGDAYVDIGAYEAYSPIYVDQNAQGEEHNGLTWTSAFINIQDALNAANPGDEIWVAEGVYYPDEGEGQTDNEPTSTFELIPGVKLYGGFAGGNDEEGMNDRDWRTNLTILNGDLDDNDDDDSDGIVTNIDNINGTNAYHVVTSYYLTETARLDGFTITAGSATGNINSQQSGGGMFNFLSGPSIANVTFIGNYALNNGGGIHCFGQKPTFINVILSGNQAGGHGGGMHNYTSFPIIVNTLFSNNQAANGGGMYNDDGSDVKLVNVTFGGNQATDGGAIHTNDSQASLANAILWGNQSDSGGPTIYNTEESTTSINYSIIEDELLSEGEGNLRQDPRFINPDEGNYRPATGSPVFDKGNNAILTETISTIFTDTTNLTDLDGKPRFVDADEDGNPIVDMGAYEIQSLLITYDLTVTLAGSGTGSVSSDPPGISCPGSCTYNYPNGSVITLTATSIAPSSFTGWSVTSCATNPTCPITLNTDINVTATFITPSKSQLYLPLVLR